MAPHMESLPLEHRLGRDPFAKRRVISE
jgi:hypothetical protein